jgi:hypothetical protein
MFGSLTWTGVFERGDCVKRFPEPRKSLPQSSFLFAFDHAVFKWLFGGCQITNSFRMKSNSKRQV